MMTVKQPTFIAATCQKKNFTPSRHFPALHCDSVVWSLVVLHPNGAPIVINSHSEKPDLTETPRVVTGTGLARADLVGFGHS